MTDIKISALSDLSSLDVADSIPVIDNSTSSTKRFTLANLWIWIQSLAPTFTGKVKTNKYFVVEQENCTIASDEITPTGCGRVQIDTEGGATSDELKIIRTANYELGATITIYSESSSRDILINYSAANMLTDGSVQKRLSVANDRVVLQMVGTDQWAEVSSSHINTKYFQNVKTAGALYCDNASISDDAVLALTPYNTSGFCLLNCNTTSKTQFSGMVVYRAAATPSCTLMTVTGNVEVAAVVLIGTTGTDGKVTISAYSDGKIYIENRSGGTLAFTWTFLGV